MRNVPVEVVFRGLPVSPALEEHIQLRAVALTRFFPRIFDIRVVVEESHRHQGKLFRVRIEIAIPGEDVVISREPQESRGHADPYVAVRDAFEAATRRLEERLQRLRGESKLHGSSAEYGEVIRLSPLEDYGFIRTQTGDDVYFHRNSVRSGRFDLLAVGERVRLTVHDSDGAEGPHGSGVRRIGRRRRHLLAHSAM
jgi:cold shock CspA family protein/ribosome-associated translation inhibitor RaiA